MELQSPQINELATALSKAQFSIENATLDATNPHFKSSYATLTSIREAVKKPLADNGLAVAQSPTMIDGKEVLVTTLMHSSGQWLRSYTSVKAEKTSPQAYGAALTYARRYALAAITGVAVEDDDAEQAMNRKPEKIDFEASLAAAIQTVIDAKTSDELKDVFLVAYKKAKAEKWPDTVLARLETQKDIKKALLAQKEVTHAG